MSNTKVLINSVAGFVVILALFFVVTDQARTPERPVDTVSIVAATEQLKNGEQGGVKAFDDVSVSALAVHVYDVRNNETLYARNADEQRAIASLTKVMTALVATEESPDPSEHVVRIDVDALLTDGESGFWYGEQWNLKELVEFTLVSSSNDGAAAIGLALNNFVEEPTFVDQMNAYATDLGLTQTYFINPTGLDINLETEPGAFGSARDMSTLFTYVLEHHPDILEVTRLPELTVASLDRVHVVENTNKITTDIPWLLGAKTGFTDHAGGNLIVAFDAGLARPIVITVLGSTIDGRFEDMQKLIDATLEYVAA